MNNPADGIAVYFISTDTNSSQWLFIRKPLGEIRNWDEVWMKVPTCAYRREPSATIQEKPSLPCGGMEFSLFLIIPLLSAILCVAALYKLHRAISLLKRTGCDKQPTNAPIDGASSEHDAPSAPADSADSHEAAAPPQVEVEEQLPEDQGVAEAPPTEEPQNECDEWRRTIQSWGMPLNAPEVGDISAWETWFNRWIWNFKEKKPTTALPEPLSHTIYPATCIHGDTCTPCISDEEADSYLSGEYADELRCIANSKQEVARRFSAWAAKQPDGTSLLLHPAPDDTFWFIGDIHGNMDALIKSLAFIRQKLDATRKNTIVFLGDLIDRGDDSWGVVSIVQHLLLNSNNQLRIIFIRGNHDEGFAIRDDGSFKSRVSPSTSVDELEEMPDPTKATELAQAFLSLVRISPCMCEISCHRSGAPGNATILVTHGGVPHIDLHSEMCKAIFEKRPEEMEQPLLFGAPLMQGLASLVPNTLYNRIRKDFEWVRMRPDYFQKIVNTSDRTSSEIGFNDINRYRCLHYLLTGRVISFILYGHQHPSKGYQVYHYHPIYNPATKPHQVQCDYGILSICAMYPDSSDLTSVNRKLAITSWSSDKDSVEVFTLPTVGAEHMKEPADNDETEA